MAEHSPDGAPFDRPADPQVYRDYMSSPDWARFKQAYWRAKGGRCAVCGTDRDVQLHHLTYERLGHELFDDVVGLCEHHHRRVHSLHRRANRDWARWVSLSETTRGFVETSQRHRQEQARRKARARSNARAERDAALRKVQAIPKHVRAAQAKRVNPRDVVAPPPPLPFWWVETTRRRK